MFLVVVVMFLMSTLNVTSYLIISDQRQNGINPALSPPPSCTPSVIHPRSFRQTQNPGNYFWKKSDEHQTYLDFEEQLMIIQELKEQGLVRFTPPSRDAFF